MTSSAYLRLSDLKENGMSWIGKQEFGLNVLDTIVGAGDYVLLIEQRDTQVGNKVADILTAENGRADNTLCALFSISGHVIPLSE